MSSNPPGSVKEKFKGWAIPGPIPPGLIQVEYADAGPVDAEVSCDVLSGHYRLFQLRDGHRFSTDDLLVAIYAAKCAPRVSRFLDLGSGLGTIAQILMWKYPDSRGVTIEAQSQSFALAKRSVTWNGTEARVDLREGDFRTSGILRADERFDLITGSPPYFPLTDGVLAEHPQKVACRFEVRGDIADYASVAARHLVPGGVFVGVFPMEPEHQWARVTESLTRAGLKLLRFRPVILRSGEKPLLVVFSAGRAEDYPPELPIWEERPLQIRESNGQVSTEYRHLKMEIGFPPTHA